MVRKTSRQRGDTIVETIVAFAVFSAVAVGTIAVMNRGVAMAQRSLEVTLVREQIDGQAELLRYIRSNVPTVWAELTKPARIVSSPAALSSSPTTCSTPHSRGYFLRGTSGGASDPTFTGASGSNYAAPAVYAAVDHTTNKSYGVWVETTEAEYSAKKAYDFRIHACWQSVGSDVPVTLGTIVRLYDK